MTNHNDPTGRVALVLLVPTSALLLLTLIGWVLS